MLDKPSRVYSEFRLLSANLVAVYVEAGEAAAPVGASWCEGATQAFIRCRLWVQTDAATIPKLFSITPLTRELPLHGRRSEDGQTGLQSATSIDIKLCKRFTIKMKSDST